MPARPTTRSVSAASKAPMPAVHAPAPRVDLLPVLLGTIVDPATAPAPAFPSELEEQVDDAAVALTDE